MRSQTLHVLTTVWQAALLFTAVFYPLAVALVLLTVPPPARFAPPPRTTSLGQGSALAASLVLPLALGLWWVLRRLRAALPRPQRLAVAFAFAALAPVALAAGLAVSPILGGYTGIFIGAQSRWPAFTGTLVGTVAIVAAITSVACWLAFRIAGLATRAGAQGPSSGAGAPPEKRASL